MSLKYRDKNGAEAVICGLTPGGDLAFGASTTRSGTISCEASSTQSYCQKNIAFTEPMPDGDYIIEIQPASGDWEVEQWTCVNKTTSGFTFVVHNINHTAPFVATNFYYNAFKLYEVSQADQNASDITDIKGKIPSTASSSNKLATSKDVNDLTSAVDERLDDLEDAVPVDANITNQLVSTSTMNTALGGKQDTLEFDDTPTAGSDNPVTSDGIKDAIDDVEGYVDDTATDIYEVMGKNGAKNFISISNILSEVVVNGGITFTPNSNRSITVNGTSTGNPARTTSIRYTAKDLGLDDNTKYIFSKGITSNQPRLELILRDSNDNVIHNYNLQGASELEVLLSDYTYEYIELRVSVSNGTTVNNVTIYPMIRDARDTDPTYQPYSMTNQQMTPYVQAISNPNLLDNPWFTVNQRGQSTYSITGSTGIFTLDRWRMGSWASKTSTMSTASDGIVFSAGVNFFRQALESDLRTRMEGRTVTLSIDYESSAASGQFGLVVDNSWDNTTVISFKSGHNIGSKTFTFPSSTTSVIAWLYLPEANTNFKVHSVKLELGAVSTLANDTAPNYQQELAKCQRYFVRIGGVTSGYPIAVGRAHNSTQGRYLIHLPVPMRSNAIVTCSDFTKVRELCNHQQSTPTSFTAGTMEGGGYLSLYTTTTGLVTDELCGLILNAEYLDISADL